jgi:hypothetical protein
MYSIFHPLDVNERLPRELILEGRRYRWFDLRHLEIFGFLYLPGLIFTVVIVGSFNMALAFVVGGLALAGVFIFALSARYR